MEGTSLCGVDYGQMAREPAHHRQPLPPAVRMDAGRQPCPRQRQLGGDLLGAGPLEEGDEPFQQPAVLGHLEPEPAADRKIVGEDLAKPAHAAPPEGHGRASGRSALRSTLA